MRATRGSRVQVSGRRVTRGNRRPPPTVSLLLRSQWFLHVRKMPRVLFRHCSPVEIHKCFQSKKPAVSIFRVLFWRRWTQYFSRNFSKFLPENTASCTGTKLSLTPLPMITFYLRLMSRDTNLHLVDRSQVLLTCPDTLSFKLLCHRVLRYGGLDFS
jgi:hypothetical protein